MAAEIIRVRDVMQRDILSIDGMASVAEAAAKMRASRTAELLVSKRNEDDAWGIITTMDVIYGVIVEGRNLDEVFVYEVMTKPVIAVPAQMDVRYVIRLMQRMGVRRAPVEDGGEVVGMFTLDALILDSDYLEKA